MDKPFILNRYGTFVDLRATYPTIEYAESRLAEDTTGLTLSFTFRLSEELRFAPTLHIPRPKGGWHVPLDHPAVQRTAFLIGLIELMSYWKATCSPVIRVQGSLDEWERAWWTRLIHRGMSEFLFRNGLPLDDPGLVRFEPTASGTVRATTIERLSGNLVPVGGGKDSTVALRLLDDQRTANTCLLLNPTPAAAAVVHEASYRDDQIVTVKRTLDPLLLDLNARGFLNGHTPFSALLAFVSVLVAMLWGRKYVVLANESSANESTVVGSSVNHQYSKSIDFEDAFRAYLKRCITPDVEYFSLLRPLNEVQIGERFGKRAGPLVEVFCSCNVGGRAGVWCGDCEKCLFAYLTLAPFVSEDVLQRVFGSDLLDRDDLLPSLERLLGVAETKPWDCVGTVGEVRSLVKHLSTNGMGSRRLLRVARATYAAEVDNAAPLPELLSEYNAHHNVPPHFASLLG